SGGAWLSATLVGTGDTTKSVGAVRVAVARAGLADGAYTGSVAVASDAGSATISVSLRVGAPAPGGGGPATDVWVLAIDPATGASAGEVLVPAGGDGTFSL